MRLQKLANDEHEAKPLIDDLKQTIESDDRYTELSDHEYNRIRYILTGLVNAAKEELISELNTTYDKEYDVGKFTRRVVDYPDPLEKVGDIIAYSSPKTKTQDLTDLHNALSTIKIYDRFTRVD